MKGAQDRRKSYADNRRRPLEFEVVDQVYLKVAPWKNIICFGMNNMCVYIYIYIYIYVCVCVCVCGLCQYIKISYYIKKKSRCSTNIYFGLGLSSFWIGFDNIHTLSITH